VLVLFLLCAGTTMSVGAAGFERTGGPYVPTPQPVVEAMLKVAGVGPDDFVVDLGSGDGRIVLTAARLYQARGFGVDIDDELVEQSNAEAKRLGLAGRVKFMRQDVMVARVEEATVVTLYLLPGMMRSLQGKLFRELRPGTRIVSHDFSFSDWAPESKAEVEIPDPARTTGNWRSTVYRWVVPPKLEGMWRFSIEAPVEEGFLLKLQQHFQKLDGSAIFRGSRSDGVSGQIEGDRISLRIGSAAAGQPALEYGGRVAGGRMQGEVLRDGVRVRWSAVRLAAAQPASR